MADLIEPIAKIVYDAMRFERGDKTPEWVDGGNSLAQVEARRAAHAIAALPAQGVRVKPLVWESVGNGQIAADLYTIGVNHSEHEGRLWLLFGGTVLATADDVDYLKNTAADQRQTRILAALTTENQNG